MIANRLGVVVYDRTDRPIAVWNNRIESLSFSYGVRGAEACSAVVRMPLADAFAWYSRAEIPTIRIQAPTGERIWVGRIEDVAIVDGGIRFTAFGFYRATQDLVDVLFVAKSNFGDFFSFGQERGTSFVEEKWEFVNEGDLIRISPRKGENFYNVVKGAMGYAIPDRCRNEIKYLAFTARMVLPASWRVEAYVTSGDWTDLSVSPVLLWSYNSTGATFTQSFAQLLLPQPNPDERNEMIWFVVYHNTGLPTTYAGETGSSYFRVSGLNFYGDLAHTGDPRPGDVVQSVVKWVNGINPYDLSSSVGGIVIDDTNDPVITDLIFEDTTPDEMIKTVAALYEGGYDYGVGNDKGFYFRPTGTARQSFLVDVETFELERLLESMFNSMYAVHPIERGKKTETERTAIYKDDPSIARFGITRRTYVDWQGSGWTEAVETELAKTKETTPRARLTIRGVYTYNGAKVPLWSLRGGDSIRVRNLPPASIPESDKISTFIVDTVTYKADTDTVDVELTIPIPSVARMLAQGLRG